MAKNIITNNDLQNSVVVVIDFYLKTFCKFLENDLSEILYNSHIETEIVNFSV